jgi:hypothetical protein
MGVEYSENDLQFLQIYRASVDPVVPHDFMKHGGGTILSREDILGERLERIAQREAVGPIESAPWAETTATAQPLTGNATCVNMPLFFGAFIQIAKQYMATKGDPDRMLPDHAFNIPVPSSLDSNSDEPQGFSSINPRGDDESDIELFSFTDSHDSAAEELRKNIKHLRDIVFIQNYDSHMERLRGLGFQTDVPKRTWTDAALAVQEADQEDTCLDILGDDLLGPIVDIDCVDSSGQEDSTGQAGLDMF